MNGIDVYTGQGIIDWRTVALMADLFNDSFKRLCGFFASRPKKDPAKYEPYRTACTRQEDN